MSDKHSSNANPNTMDWAQRRAAKNISLQQISDRTNIPVSKLEALEAGRFSDLGLEAFILGYIRAYAKNLQEDPEAYVAVYKATPHKSEEPQPLNRATGQPYSPAPSSGLSFLKQFGMIHFVIVAIALWCLLILLFNDSEPEEVTPSSPVPVAEQASPVVSEEDLVSADAMAASDATDVIPEQVETEVPPEPLDGIDQGIEEATFASDAIEQESGQAPSLDVELVSEAVDEVEATALPEDEPVDKPGFVVEEDILVMNFSEDCWVEISQKDNRVLIAELKRKGDNLQLFGQAPFSVMLGNARAVTMSFNGEPVSTVPPGNRKTLRVVVE